MTNKLYLINPPNPLNMKGFSGSLLSLDLWVRKHCQNTESTIINEEETKGNDLKFSLERKLVHAPERPYFGITCTTATYQDALATARTLKRIRPNSTIILGGHHVDGQEQVILGNHPEIDLTVTGEGEKALEGILNDKRDIQGVTYRRKPLLQVLPNRSCRGVRLTKEELNSLDISQYDPNFFSTQFEETNLVTARGCPMKCSFCAVSGDKPTAQDSDLIVKQVDYIFRKNQEKGLPTVIAIQDNFFAQNPERAKEIARKLIEYRERTGNEFEWNIQTRVEQFADPGLASLMARAGCSASYFGVENFDPRMLKILNKANNPSQYIRQTNQAIQNCLINGVNPHIDFQVGIPDENGETVRINERALREIGENARKYNQKPIVFPSLSVVYPATALYHGMIEKLGVPHEIYETFTRCERVNPEYRQMLHGYFAHGNGGIPLGIVELDSLRRGEIDVNMKKLLKVKRYVDRLRTIDTLTVHDYTKERREKCE